MSQNFQFKAEPTDQGARLDKFLSEKLEGYSRAAIQKMIKEKNVLVSGKGIKPSHKLKAGDIIEIKLPDEKKELAPDSSIKFEVIHDEKDFAVIDKPAGFVVYPGTKHEEKTLANGLLAKWPEIKSVGDPEYSGLRPGIVHRLDKDTSGLMIIAKNNNAFQYFKNLFKEKKIEKTYIALVYGKIEKQEGVIDFPIRRSRTNPVKQVAVKGKKGDPEAREAITGFKVLKYLSDKAGNQYTLVEAMPKTGRMHQIRVHLAAIGHPIVGDKIYTRADAGIAPEIIPLKSHFLHATRLKFISLEEKTLEFSSLLPKDLNTFLKTLIDIHP